MRSCWGMVRRLWRIFRLKFEKFGGFSKEGDKERRIVESHKRDQEGVTLEHRFERNSERTATAISMMPRRAASWAADKSLSALPLHNWCRCTAGAAAHLARCVVGLAEPNRGDERQRVFQSFELGRTGSSTGSASGQCARVPMCRCARVPVCRW
jgi:hypothetical protein